jgi:MYXO-CTERM domain-containing protein
MKSSDRKLGLSASLVVLATLLAGRNAQATDYYVAATGSDSNAGTMAAPFATLQKAVNTAVAGDTVYIRGGTYSITTPATSGAGINFTKSGTATAPINYFAYPGEVPVFDFTNMVISTTGYTHGFVINASYLHFKGLEVRYVPMNTFSNNGVDVLSGGNDTFELLNMHHNSGNGIFIGSKSAGGHLILNCDAHDNYDATSSQGQGQNADGFGVHYQTTGASTTIRGCRSWWNSDDGYDLINQEVPVTVENSWAFGNGYAMYGTFNPADGNGNGFKMGSSQTGIRHLVQNNVAWKNKANGFYANHSTGGNTWYNNTSFMNGTQYNMLASPAGMPDTTITLTGSLAHIMRNNIGYPNKNTNMTGVDTMFNTWDLNITPAAKDFASITDPSVSPGTGVAVESSGALGPRAADGSMPAVDFLQLAAGSQMIDKGMDVGLPYVGAAPDLGAYEYGAAGSSGTGGTTGSGSGGTTGSGSGGTTGAGGATTVGTGAGGSSAAGGTSGAGASGNAGASGTAGSTGSNGQAGANGGTGSGGAGTATGAGATGGAGATTGQTGAGPAAETSSSGCSCSVDTGSGTLRSLLVMMGALAALLVGRRRRRAAGRAARV